MNKQNWDIYNQKLANKGNLYFFSKLDQIGCANKEVLFGKSLFWPKNAILNKPMTIQITYLSAFVAILNKIVF